MTKDEEVNKKKYVLNTSHKILKSQKVQPKTIQQKKNTESSIKVFKLSFMKVGTWKKFFTLLMEISWGIIK